MKRVGFAALAIACGLTVQAADTVTLDVVVTDGKLRPIEKLTAADFEVIEADEARPPEAVRLDAEPQRVIGLFLDDFHVADGAATERVRTALTRFVKTQLHAADRVAVVKPLDPLHAITVTARAEQILEAVARFEGRKGDYRPRTPFEESYISRDPRTAAVSRAQIVTAALQALAARLGGAGDGRKALILVSEGFATTAMRAIVLAANRHGVAIYVVDPAVEPDANDQALQALAEQTGGTASVNQSDLNAPLTQALSDLDRHYLLTYQPLNADGKFHPVRIRLKRPGAVVRARGGYWAASPAPAASSASARTGLELPFRPAHSSPYIRPWVGMSRGSDGMTRVTVTWEPAAAPPRNQRIAAITVKALAPDGAVVFQRRFGPGDAGGGAFDARPGYIAIEMAIQSSTGAALDSDYRAVPVPDLHVTRPTISTPQVFRARTAREFAELTGNPMALPVAARTFSRAERLLVRVPAYGPDDSTPEVSARLLNRAGMPMRELPRVAGADGPAQFDVQLSSLAPDEYRVELVAGNEHGPRDEARELVVFRVTN